MSAIGDLFSATGVGEIFGIESGAEKATKKAAGIQESTIERGLAEQRRQFDLTREDLQAAQLSNVEALRGGEAAQIDQLSPFSGAGVEALNRQRSLLGFGGEEEQQAAFSAFGDSRGQRFLQDRAQKNLLRSASAIGGIGGGNVRSALVEQGVGFAQQDFANKFDRLSQLRAAGQDAASQIGAGGLSTASQRGSGAINTAARQGQFAQNFASSFANLQQAGGQARASGILGAQQARTDQLGNLLQLSGGFI